MNTELNELYTEKDSHVMNVAENARIPGKNRVEEIRKFANISGIKRIGIAHCVAVTKEANALKNMLSNEFEVSIVDCKHGKIPSSAFCGPEAKGVSCNPAGQALYLAEQNTELNISMGLCVGHDMMFNQKSKAPVTTLIVKDREHNHNPIQTFRNTNL